MPHNRTEKIALKAYNRAKEIALVLRKPCRVAHIGQAEIPSGKEGELISMGWLGIVRLIGLIIWVLFHQVKVGEMGVARLRQGTVCAMHVTTPLHLDKLMIKCLHVRTLIRTKKKFVGIATK